MKWKQTRLSLTSVLLWISHIYWVHDASEFSVNAFVLDGRRGTRRLVLSKMVSTPDARPSEQTIDSTKPQEKSSSCPFSRAYPRYRIDLTAPSSKKKRTALFSWATTNPKSRLLSTTTANSLEWKTGYRKAAVLAYLWRTADTLSQSSSSSPQRKTTDSSVLIAFPDASRQVVCQWVDLFQWSQEQQLLQQPLLSSSDATTATIDNPCLRATYQDEHDIPAVLFQVNHHAMNSFVVADKDDHAALREEQQNLLDDTIITKRTQAWVKRILVQQGICPFTKSVRTSGQGLSNVGVPVGRIAYHTSSATHQQICALQADIWQAIQNMLVAGAGGPTGVSSILLAAPHWDEYFEAWAGPVFCLLEAGVLAAGIEQEIGVVCFHPYYQIPDGSSWPGFGHMHSAPRLQKWVLEQDPACPFADRVAAGGAWQRRTPHATVNVLRAEQLAAAEGLRKSSELYYRNIRKLVADPPDGIGLDLLQQDLDRERRIGETGP